MQYHNTLVDVFDKMNFSKLVPGTSRFVIVTHIEDPANFYVRLSALNQALTLLEVPGGPITHPLGVGSLVVYKSSTLKKYIRGAIESLNVIEGDSSYSLNAIDYGSHDVQVPLKDLYMPASYVGCPSLAIHCGLHLCVPNTDTYGQDAIDAMKYFVGNNTCKIKIVSNIAGKLTVKLRTSECPDDIAKMLALLHYTRMTGPANAVNRFATPSMTEINRYTNKKVKLGAKLHVRVQSGDSISNFYVAEVVDYNKYLKCVNQQFNKYCKKQPVVDAVAAAADQRSCGVKYNDKYERAIVKSIIAPGNYALVNLIDWGKDVQVHIAWIKSVASQFHTNHPAIAIHCTSTEDQVWETSWPKFLYPGNEFIIEIIELGDGISVPNKVNLLRCGK